jgi:hypothetical protein
LSFRFTELLAGACTVSRSPYTETSAILAARHAELTFHRQRRPDRYLYLYIRYLKECVVFYLPSRLLSSFEVRGGRRSFVRLSILHSFLILQVKLLYNAHYQILQSRTYLLKHFSCLFTHCHYEKQLHLQPFAGAGCRRSRQPL